MNPAINFSITNSWITLHDVSTDKTQQEIDNTNNKISSQVIIPEYNKTFIYLKFTGYMGG